MFLAVLVIRLLVRMFSSKSGYFIMKFITFNKNAPRKAAFFMATLIFSALNGGCVTTRALPENSMPAISSPDLFHPDTLATPLLDCLSAELRPFRNTKIRLVVGDLDNEMGQQIGDLTLPRNMKPFVENTIARISNVFELYDTGDLTGIWGYERNLLPAIGIVGGANEVKAVQGDIIRADIAVTGRLYMAQVTKSAALDVELYGLGIGGKAKAYDLSLQLKLVDPKTFRVLGAPVSLRVRTYAAEQGASAFVLHSGNFSRGQATFLQGSPVHYALQYLTDQVVFSLFSEYTSSKFGAGFSGCKNRIDDKDWQRTPDQIGKPDQQGSLKITLYKKAGTYCASVTPKKLSAKHVHIIWRQYRDPKILLEPSLHDTPPVEFLQAGICIPLRYQHTNVDLMEVVIKDEDSNVLGSAYVRTE